MKVAVFGTRGLYITNLKDYLPEDTTELLCGGSVGMDTVCKKYAEENNIPLTVMLPDYKRYGRKAPFIRNERMADAADFVLAIWDGESLGIKKLADYCQKKGIPYNLSV